MKHYILIIWLMVWVTHLNAQTGLINNGGYIKVTNGAVISLSGGETAGLTNNGNGYFDLEGQIRLTGNWVNNSAAYPVFYNINNTGTTSFVGTLQQSIGGTYSTTFENLTLNNTSGFILENHQSINNSFNMVNGVTNLDAYNLTMGSISNLSGSFGTNNMLVSGNGGMFRFTPVLNSYKYLPVGDNTGTTEYSSLYFSIFSGTFGADPKVEVKAVNSKHPSNTSSTDYLNRYWVMSSTDITNMSARVYAFYNQADVAGNEANIQPGSFLNGYWQQGAYIYTAGNYLRFDNLSSLADFTGGEAGAFTVSISVSNASTINEGFENGGVIDVTLTNAEFSVNPNVANWQFYNLPVGVTVGSITYVDAHHVKLNLSGNRTVDYDSDILNFEAYVNQNDVPNLASGVWLSDNSGVAFTAIDDDEYIQISYDGTITEGSENGEVITITLFGGTFTNPINSANWVIENLPDGVGYNITLTNDTVASITLLNNALEDYDANIGNLTVTIPDTEIDDYIGVSHSINTGVVFTAVIEPLTLAMSSDGTILEMFENNEVITISISGKTFATTLDSASWLVSNLPTGVSWRSLERLDANTARITLSGNRTMDYDNNITNLSVQILDGEIDSYSGIARINAGVVFTADNDAELLTVTLPEPIIEGSENGKAIEVDLENGTFFSTLDKLNWSISNLPAGVSIGSVYYQADTLAIVTLFGNATVDYDADIDLNLTIQTNQLSDISSPISGAGQASIVAINDIETIAMTGVFTEGNEDGGMVQVEIEGGKFLSTIQLTDVELTNLPLGIATGSVTYVNDTIITITLSGNSQADYDTDSLNSSLTISNNAYNEGGSNLTTNTGIVFDAIDEPVILSLTSQPIYEATEDGSVLKISITEDVLVSQIDGTNCLVKNLPIGVSVDTMVRVSDTWLEITLTGNRLVDYDNHIDTIHVKLLAGAFTQHNYNVSSNNITFTANNDVEYVNLSQLPILEGSESSSELVVTLTGGTFASTLNSANWTIENGPSGVSVGSVVWNSATEALITLLGNSTADYDDDVMASLVIHESEIDDYIGAGLFVLDMIKFTATLEPIAISIANASGETIYEGSENGKAIEVTVLNDEFVLLPDLQAWNIFNLPAGVNADTLIRTDNTHVNLMLSGNASVDFDSDLMQVIVVASGSQFVRQTITISDSTGVVITAINDAETIQFTDANIIERTESGQFIEAVLSGGTFANELSVSEWALSGQPSGVELGDISRISNTIVHLYLSGNATSDFDTDSTNFSVSVGYTQIDEHTLTDGPVNGSGNVVFDALVEGVEILASVDTLNEQNINGATLLLDLANDYFSDFNLDVANFTLNNAPQGIFVSAIQYETDSTARIMFTYNGSDFDVDYNNVFITIDQSELTSQGEIITPEFAIKSIMELPYIVISDDGIVEQLENGEMIYVELFEDKFIETLNPSEWVIQNLPTGVTLSGINRVDSTHLQLVLAGNREVDYDNNITNFSLTIPANQLVQGLSHVSSSSGVKFQAIDDAESISFDSKIINEGTEDNQVLTVRLTGGTFVNPVNLANWTLENLPQGVSLGALAQPHDTIVELVLSGNRTADYDADILNLIVKVNQSDLDDFTSGFLSANSGIEFKANTEKVLTATSSISESDLNGFVLKVYLSGDTYLPAIPNLANFALINAPLGLSVSQISYQNPDTALLTLEYTNADFDADQKIVVRILDEELFGIGNLETDSITLVAINDDEIISINTDANGIFEGNEDGEVISVLLTGGVFTDTLTTPNWLVTNLPSGVNYYLARINSQRVHVILTGNRTYDYDSDITDVTITVPASDVIDYYGSAFALHGITFVAYNEQLFIEGSLAEASLNGSVVALKLNDEKFADESLLASNFELINAPYGLSILSVNYVNDTTAQLVLQFNNSDFDADITNFGIVVNQTELLGLTNLTSNPLSIIATIEPESITVSHAGLTEMNLNGAILALNLTSVAFADASLSASNFNLINSPNGCTVSAVQYLGINQAQVTLAFDSTDFDANYALQISVDGMELTGNRGVTSNPITIIANNDAEFISLSSENEIVEGSEQNSNITISLVGGDFNANLDFNQWTYQNLPNGLVIENYSLLNDSTITATLIGTRNTDFDSDQTVTLIIPQLQITEADSNVTTQIPLIIMAVNDAEAIAMNDDGWIEEGMESGEKISLHLTGGTFVPNLLPDHFNILNLPMGIAIGGVTQLSSTKAELILSGNTLVDYDTALSLILSISEIAMNDYTGIDIIVNSGATLMGHYEVADRVLTLNDTAISEHNLNDFVLQFELQHESFADAILDAQNFTLVNSPAFVSIESVVAIDQNTGQLNLKYNWTDFDADLDSIYLKINGTELLMGVELTSNLLRFEAINEVRSAVLETYNLTEKNLDGSVLNLRLFEDVFASKGANQSHFTLNNAPSGVTISEVVINDSVSASVQLSFDKTDFDIDYNVSIGIDGLALASVQALTTQNQLITAYIEVPKLTLMVDSLTESTLDLAEVQLLLFDDAFVNTELDTANVTLNGAPISLQIKSLVVTSDTTANVIFEFDGTDFDVDSANFNMVVEGVELKSAQTLASNAIVVKAVNDPEAISIHTPVAIYEGTENGALIEANLSGGTWAKTLTKSAWTALNLPLGVIIDTVWRQNSKTALISLKNNSSLDFDTVLAVSILVNESQIDDYQGEPLASTDSVYINAIIEEPVLTILNANSGLHDNNINGAVLNLKLTEATFVGSVKSIDGIAILNGPGGLDVSSFTIVNDSLANITLSFNGGIIDQDYFPQIAIAPNLTDYNDTIVSNHFEVWFSSNPAIALIQGPMIEEGFEEGSKIMIGIHQATFNDLPTLDWITIEKLPQGVEPGSIYFDEQQQALVIELMGNRTVDYDSDLDLGNVTIKAKAINSYFGNDIVLISQKTFKARNELAVVSHSGLTQQNLNGAHLQLSLSDDWFILPTLASGYFELQNAPQGLSIEDVELVDSANAILTLTYDGTEISSDISDFHITVSELGLFGVANLTTNNLVIDDFNSVPGSNFWGMKIYANKTTVHVLVNNPPQVWTSSGIEVYDNQGRLINVAELSKNDETVIKLNVISGNYIVKATINKASFIQKVFIEPE